MMNLFLFLISGISVFSAFTEDFKPGYCPDLNARIYPGNGAWRILHVTSSFYASSSLGYDFVGVLTTGKPSEKRMRTCLRMDMGLGKSARLDFLMTIPDTVEHSYSLVTEYRWGIPAKTIPLKTACADEGKLVFRSPLSTVIIDVKSNTAECASAAGKRFPVKWLEDGFEIRGLPEETGIFQFVMPLSNYRGCDGGVTAVRRKIGKTFLFFPVYETFYLESDNK